MPGGSRTVANFNQWDLLNSPVDPALLDIGDDRIEAYLNDIFTAHSRQTAEVVDTLGIWTTQNQLPYGGFSRVSGYVVGEGGRAKPTKGGVGYFCGLPLQEWQAGVQWSNRYRKQARESDLAKDTVMITTADADYVIATVLNAITNPVNYSVDDVIERRSVEMPIVPMKVKALLNADGLEIPPGPNGERFDAATHTHYDYDSDVTAAKLSSLVRTVREHNRNSDVKIWINPAEVTKFKALPSTNFTPVVYSNILQATTRDVINSPRLVSSRNADYTIGFYDDAEVIVKYQWPANYVLAIDMNAPIKPVAVRFSATLGSGRALGPVGETEDLPWYARTWGRYIGAGCVGRSSAAVLNVNQGGGAYVAPTYAALNY